MVASLPSTWLGKNTTIDHISQRVTYKIKPTTLTSYKHKTSNLEQFHVFSKPWIVARTIRSQIFHDTIFITNFQHENS